MVRIIRSLLLMLIYAQHYACNIKNNPTTEDNTISVSKMDGIKVRIAVGEKTATAIVYDNPTSKNFVSLFPLTLELEDYNGIEKINLLSQKLTAEGAPKGFDPATGDLTYYEPWGNIALFYKDFGYANGLISLGKITSGLEAFAVSGTVVAKFELDK